MVKKYTYSYLNIYEYLCNLSVILDNELLILMTESLTKQRF